MVIREYLRENLKELTEFLSPTGMEKTLSEYIRERIKPIVDEVYIDDSYNLVALQKGKGPKIMLTAHLDEVFMFVKKIDRGYIILDTNRIDENVLPAQEVSVLSKKGNFRGTIGMTPPHLKENEKISEIYCDIGFSPEKAGIKVGDYVVFKPGWINLNENMVSSKSLDNRVSCCVLLSLIERTEVLSYNKNVIFLWSVQEEKNSRGVITGGFKYHPDEAIVLDVSFGISPYDKNETSLVLGKGPAIGVGPFIAPYLKNSLLDTASRYKIPHQIEVLPSRTGTDLDRLSLVREGIPNALLSIPIRYMHTPREVVHLGDIEHTLHLLEAFIKER